VSQGHEGLWEQTGSEHCVHVGSCTYGWRTRSQGLFRMEVCLNQAQLLLWS